MADLIERLRECCRNADGIEMPDHAEPWGAEVALLREAAAALEAAREDADAVKRVLAVVEEFEGCTGAGYRYMAANIRSAIDQARGKGGAGK